MFRKKSGSITGRPHLSHRAFTLAKGHGNEVASQSLIVVSTNERYPHM